MSIMLPFTTTRFSCSGPPLFFCHCRLTVWQIIIGPDLRIFLLLIFFRVCIYVWRAIWNTSDICIFDKFSSHGWRYLKCISDHGPKMSTYSDHDPWYLTCIQIIAQDTWYEFRSWPKIFAMYSDQGPWYSTDIQVMAKGIWHIQIMAKDILHNYIRVMEKDNMYSHKKIFNQINKKKIQSDKLYSDG